MMVKNLVIGDLLPEGGHVFFERMHSLCLEIILCPLPKEELMQSLLDALLNLEFKHIILAARVLAHLHEDYSTLMFQLIRNQLKPLEMTLQVIQFVPRFQVLQRLSHCLLESQSPLFEKLLTFGQHLAFYLPNEFFSRLIEHCLSSSLLSFQHIILFCTLFSPSIFRLNQHPSLAINVRS